MRALLRMFWNSLKINSLSIFLCFFIFSGCDLVKMKDKPNDEATESTEVIARVYDKNLLKKDISSIISEDTSPEDSANIISRYVKSWIKKQLLINEAASTIDFDEAELERKILDYRYALMIYEYEKYYINDELDKEVSEAQIEDFYKNNLANFELKQNIVRGMYIKVAKDAPKIERLKKLIHSNKNSDKKELKSYCFRFATSYSLDDSLWVNFDELIKNTPLMGMPNKVQFLRENEHIETEDEEFLYFIRISDYKISDQISPLEFVKDEIANIIINKRKLELAKQLEERIYDQAKENEDFEIFTGD